MLKYMTVQIRFNEDTYLASLITCSVNPLGMELNVVSNPVIHNAPEARGGGPVRKKPNDYGFLQPVTQAGYV